MEDDKELASLIGTALGRYRVQSVLSRTGGFGVVFQGCEVASGQEVAIKVCRPSNHPSITKRFRKEAEVMARMKHNNVVGVLDLDVVSAIPWYAMPLASSTLHRRRRDFFEDREKCFVLAKTLLGALAYLRDMNVTHRDLKPTNILYYGDVPKLTDFGLCKMPDAGIGETETGDSFGTPGYVSPEQQLDASRVDIRADLFSLGVTLHSIYHDQAPPKDHTEIDLRSLPRDLAYFVGRSLIHRDLRYQHPEEAQEDVSLFLTPVGFGREQPSAMLDVAAKIRALLDDGHYDTSILERLLCAIGRVGTVEQLEVFLELPDSLIDVAYDTCDRSLAIALQGIARDMAAQVNQVGAAAGSHIAPKISILIDKLRVTSRPTLSHRKIYSAIVDGSMGLRFLGVGSMKEVLKRLDAVKWAGESDDSQGFHAFHRARLRRGVGNGRAL